MHTLLRSIHRTAAFGASVSAVCLLASFGTANAGPPNTTKFSLFVNPANLNCLKGKSGTPTATATVVRGSLNDTLTISLKHFKPKLQFDLFTIQNSNQLAAGGKDPKFKGFGLAWYQSDLDVNSDGEGSATIKTILLDQIFGFDDIKSLTPVNTFHVGFWFNKPSDATACGFQGFTPFNGEHKAGPLAFITRPNAKTGLGPLCTNPNTAVNPAKCKP
jgi:hypothetical protein